MAVVYLGADKKSFILHIQHCQHSSARMALNDEKLFLQVKHNIKFWCEQYTFEQNNSFKLCDLQVHLFMNCPEILWKWRCCAVTKALGWEGKKRQPRSQYLVNLMCCFCNEITHALKELELIQSTGMAMLWQNALLFYRAGALIDAGWNKINLNLAAIQSFVFSFFMLFCPCY